MQFSKTSYFSDGARSDEFLNRELSWLGFNERVLAQAADLQIPLLERVRFLCIFSSNLDEFIMKRVGGLKCQVAAGVCSLSSDKQTPVEQLNAIRHEVLRLIDIRGRLFSEYTKPELETHGIYLLHWNELDEEEQNFSSKHFHEKVFPMLTPLAVDPGHPFPFLSNLSHSIAVALKHPSRGEKLFARVKTSLPVAQWVLLPPRNGGGEYRFISLREIILHSIQDLFPGMEIVSSMPFRVTRNAEVEFVDDDADDLLETIEEELNRRRFAQAVRLEIGSDPDPWICNFLKRELEVDEADVYEIDGELDFSTLEMIANLELPELKYKPWLHVVPPDFLSRKDLFGVLKRQDVLVHHPYESFSASVERFVREAAEDPLVRAIKVTVYRIGDEDPLIPLLIRAAENGKQVVCLIELKARFDEERNIRWAQTLEDTGVHVVFGVVGLKTHAKTILVVRDEPEGIRSYAHIGTGNYHSITAKLYTDVGLFTSRSEYTEELAHFFNYLSGRSMKSDYKTLLVAPVNLRTGFIEMIEREIDHQRNGRKGYIVAKMNSLQDKEICQTLYRASSEGVVIDLIVRGFCTLRPGVVGLSENIRVVSVLGRLLEHSRIFYFRNGNTECAEGEFYIGSADWMNRNLDYRVEIVAPLLDPVLRNRCWEILQAALNDPHQAWDMQSDGSYIRRGPADDSPLLGTQEYLMSRTKQQARQGST